MFMKNKFLFALIAIFVLAGVILSIRFIFGGNEDDWICVNEQWVRHGNPANQPPQSGCGNGGIKEEARGERPGEFSNGQIYLTFKTDNFEMKYPNWPRIDMSKAAGTNNIEVAVSNAGCNFIVKNTVVAPDATLKAYIEEAIRSSGTNIKMNKQEIIGDRATFDADIMSGEITIKQVSSSFKIGNSIYSAAFIAEAKNFSESCGPIVNDAIESVKISR